MQKNPHRRERGDNINEGNTLVRDQRNSMQGHYKSELMNNILNLRFIEQYKHVKSEKNVEKIPNHLKKIYLESLNL